MFKKGDNDYGSSITFTFTVWILISIHLCKLILWVYTFFTEGLNLLRLHYCLHLSSGCRLRSFFVFFPVVVLTIRKASPFQRKDLLVGNVNTSHLNLDHFVYLFLFFRFVGLSCKINDSLIPFYSQPQVWIIFI